MSRVCSQPFPCMTRLMTSAAKLSPLRMSCGFSSENTSKSGSTMQNPGSVPASASAKNCSVRRRCRTQPAMPSGYRSAVNCLLPWTRLVIRGNQRPIPGRPDVVIVDPADAVLGQHVEDGAGGRQVEDVPRQVVDQPVGGARDHE